MGHSPQRDAVLEGVTLTNDADTGADTDNLLDPSWSGGSLDGSTRSAMIGLSYALSTVLCGSYSEEGANTIALRFDVADGEVTAIGLYDADEDDETNDADTESDFEALDADDAAKVQRAAEKATQALAKHYAVDEDALEGDLADVMARHISPDDEG